MILETEIKKELTNKNRKFYKNLGYDISKEFIFLQISDLPKASHQIITAKCDVCGNIKKIMYKTYNYNFSNSNFYACSIKCSNKKYKNSILKKYGVEYITQSSEIQEKIKQTNLEKYGNECYFKTYDKKQKTKQTNLEKYGFEYATQNNEIKEKTEQTNLERYGNKMTLNNTNIKDKAILTNIERYGFEHPMKNKIIQDKTHKTNIERYGFKIAIQNSDIKNKAIKTNIERYGVETPLENIEILNNMYEHNLEKYGVKKTLLLKSIQEKTEQTNLEKYGVKNIFSNKDIIADLKIKKIEYIKKENIKTFNKYEKIIDKEYKLESYDKKIFNITHITCNNTYDMTFKHFYDRYKENIPLCTVCYPISDQKSIKEKEIINWLKSLNISLIESDNTILKPKHLDIYIPSHNLAIEFNGLLWHSEKYKSEYYHLNKTLDCLKHNINLIHIWEDEWCFKKDIIKSIILNKLNLIGNKIYSRNCIIKEIKDTKLIRKFLDENHIQGYSQSSIKIGLFYNNELVSIMTFGYRYTNSKKEFELIRFCNKINTNVIGSASKLFKYFLNNYKEETIISYSDFRMFDGKLYETLGFEKIHLSEPNYYWCKGIERSHRYNFNKKKLVKEGFDPNKTEVEIMWDRGYNRIFGCGQYRWVYKNNIY